MGQRHVKSDNPKTGIVQKSESSITDELIAIFRDRVASRYYDQPRVIDAVARAILKSQAIAPTP